MAPNSDLPLLPISGPTGGPGLAATLKALRRHRRMRPAEVAAAMGMPLRSYEHFESGRGLLNVERITAFAEVVKADAFAILASVAFDSPDFAVRCADNKLMLILMMAVQDFDAAAREGVSHLQSRTLITAFARVFAELRQAAAQGDAFLADWLARKRPPGGGPPSDQEGDGET